MELSGSLDLPRFCLRRCLCLAARPGRKWCRTTNKHLEFVLRPTRKNYLHQHMRRMCALSSTCVMREMQSFQGTEQSNKGPQKYVERTPNPTLNSFTPVDLNDVRRRNTQDSKKS